MSSAAGAQGEATLPYVSAISKDLKAQVIPVVGGDESDNDFTAEDVIGVMQAIEAETGEPLREIILGNEPTNSGELDMYIERLPSWIAAARGVNPDTEISIASMPDIEQGGQDLARIIEAARGDFDRIGVHAYRGHLGVERSGEIRGLMQAISEKYGRPVDVEEYNWHPDNLGDGAFYDARNVLYTASFVGHVAKAGGRSFHYGDVNGFKGYMHDGRNGVDGQPGSLGTPFSVYRGLEMWTGSNGAFRGYGKALVAAESSLENVEVFATSNGKIIVVSKKGEMQEISVGMGGAQREGEFSAWQTNGTAPLDAPSQVIKSSVYTEGTLSMSLPPGTVTSIEIN